MTQLRRHHGSLARAEWLVDGIAVLDRNGRLLWANPVFLARTGYTEQQLVGMRPWDRLLHGDTDASTIRSFRRALTVHQPFDGTVVQQSAAGEVAPVRIILQPIVDNASLHDGFIVTLVQEVAAPARPVPGRRSDQRSPIGDT